jgi:hypothetical protein
VTGSRRCALVSRRTPESPETDSETVVRVRYNATVVGTRPKITIHSTYNSIGDHHTSMNNSDSASNSPRPTLKLKVAPRKAPEAPKPPPSGPHSKASQKPGAHWSDEYKQRMQEDMDRLAR